MQRFVRNYSTGLGQNAIEWITQRHITPKQVRKVRSGDIVMLEPRHILSHDNTAAIMKKFSQLSTRIKLPKQPVFVMDHDIQNTSASNLAKYQEIKQFAQEQGVDYYEPGSGIGHQVMIERGYAFPLSLCVASDSHANMYGGIGVLGTPLVRTDAAAIWATGTTWWQIPPCIGVRLEGALRPGVYGKDVILTLCGLFNKDQVLNAALVFYGPGVASLSISDRLAIANMTTEWGSLAGLFPVDDAVIAWLNKNPYISQERINTLDKSPDYSQGPYAKELMLDLSSVMPSITGPDSVKIVRPATELLGQPINKAYLLSCANARTEDLGEAAKVIRDLGGKVAEGVEFYVAAASRDVQQAAERTGDWQVLMEAGAIPLPAGCGPCIGLGSGVLKDGQVGISATNRNYKGRMGSVNAKTFLSSPAVVAASALAGHISLPFPVDKTTIIYAEKTFPHQSESHAEPGQEKEEEGVVEGFPEMVQGKVILCAQDNINTDAIYAGKYTYREDMTSEMMKRVVMENYDPLFKEIVEKGDVLVAGFNFGTGSSREQAATALLAAGIQCVIAGSFSQTFFRNSINNGLLCLSSPALLKHLKAQKGNDKIRREAEIDVWPHSGVISYQGRTWHCDRIGRAAQQLIAKGGLTNWVENEMNMLT